MPNAYANLKTIKSVSLLDISGGSHDTRLLELLEDTSRWIDQHCNRHFFTLQATRLFDVQRSSTRVLVPDLVRITSLKSDGDGDKLFDTAWASGDYILYPLNADPTQPWGRPYTRLEVDSGSGGLLGARTHSPRGRSTLQIAGVWGFREDLRTSAAVVDGMGIDAAATEFGVNGGMPFSPGDTLVIGSEQMYVTSTGTNKLKVERGVNGTSTSRHAAASPIKAFRYPAGVAEACLVQAARLWKRKDLAFGTETQGSRAAGNGDFGQFDPDIRRMLSPYRKPAV